MEGHGWPAVEFLQNRALISVAGTRPGPFSWQTGEVKQVEQKVTSLGGGIALEQEVTSLGGGRGGLHWSRK